MCKITFNELSCSKLKKEVVNHFESWFRFTFDLKPIHIRDVLAEYISSLEPHPDVVKHLLSIQKLLYRSVVFTEEMDMKGSISLKTSLFIPAGSIVNSKVEARGIYSSGDVLFLQSVKNTLNDIRINGRMVVQSLECRKGGCIVTALSSKGDVFCEGDLLVKGHLECGGQLQALSYVKARNILVDRSVSLKQGLEVDTGFVVGSSFVHRGALDITQSLEVGKLAA